MHPIGNKVAIRLEAVQETTSSGIILTSKKDSICKGVVIATGNGTISNGVVIPVSVNFNDKVLFNLNHSIEVNIDGNIVHFIREDDIICVL